MSHPCQWCAVCCDRRRYEPRRHNFQAMTKVYDRKYGLICRPDARALNGTSEVKKGRGPMI